MEHGSLLKPGMEWNTKWNGIEIGTNFGIWDGTGNANWNGMEQNKYETWNRNRTGTVD